MTTSVAVWTVIGIAFLAANLPWLSERFFFVSIPKSGVKRAWQRWLEWLLLYGLVGGVAVGIERKLNGDYFSQAWEFYVVTLCLFFVFALPGFVYRHDLKHHLDRRHMP